MTKEIIDIHGNKATVDCIGCAIQNGIIERPSGGIVLTKHFDAHQDVEILIPGFIILASRRHVLSIDEFSEEEQLDFINTLCRIRSALKSALGIKTVYLVQEEDSSDHFHIWIFPRYKWMAENFGTKIESLRPIMEYARNNLKTADNLDNVRDAIEKLKLALDTNL